MFELNKIKDSILLHNLFWKLTLPDSILLAVSVYLHVRVDGLGTGEHSATSKLLFLLELFCPAAALLATV